MYTRITDSIDPLSVSVFFSTLDLISRYFLQVIWSEDRHKTTIMTHRGLHYFNIDPFGLFNLRCPFTRLMSCNLDDLTSLDILVYIDGINISSKDIDIHREKL